MTSWPDHPLSGIQKRFLAILRFPELALVFVRCDHIASVIVKRESQHHVSGQRLVAAID
jgi:hypothetical protein